MNLLVVEHLGLSWEYVGEGGESHQLMDRHSAPQMQHTQHVNRKAIIALAIITDIVLQADTRQLSVAHTDTTF